MDKILKACVVFFFFSGAISMLLMGIKKAPTMGMLERYSYYLTSHRHTATGIEVSDEKGRCRIRYTPFTDNFIERKCYTNIKREKRQQ